MYVGDVLLFWAGPKKEKMLLLFASPWNQAKEASSQHDIHVLSVEALSGLLLAIPLCVLCGPSGSLLGCSVK